MTLSHFSAPKLLPLLLDNLQDHALIIMDKEGCIVSWTPEIERFLGYDESEFLEQHIGLIFTSQDRLNRVPEAELEVAKRTGRAEDVRWHQRKDGSLFWANGQLLALRDEEGELSGFAKILRDDTRHKQAEDALRDTRQRLQRALDAGSIGTWEWDLQADRIVADPNLARFFGLSPEEAAGCPVGRCLQSIHSDDVERVEEDIQEAVRTCGAFTSSYRILQPDGGVIWGEASGQVQPDARGQAAFLNGVVVDISGRRRADAALRHSEERYRALFEAIDIGFCVIEVIFDAGDQPVDYRFIEINPAFERQTGLQGAVGKTARELVPDLDHHWFETYGRVATTGESIHFEDAAAAMGRVFDVHAFRTGSVQDRRVAILFTDITQTRRQQQTLQLLVDLNEATQPLTDPDEIMIITARFLGQFLEVNRCAYAQVEEDQDHFTIIGDYTRDTLSMTGTFQLTAFGEEALRLLGSGEPYIIEDVETDARTAAHLASYRKIDLAAGVSVPLHKEGRFVAVMAVHQKVARRWTPDEIELIQLVVNGCWEAIERTRAERDLRQSQARLSFMAESMPQKIFTANAEGEVDYFNEQWMEFTGLSFEQIKSWGWTQFIHPDDVEENVRRWSHSISSGELFELEHRFRRADGEYRWHLSRAHAMRDASGRVLMWLGSNTDIDEVKRVEEEKARLLNEAQEVNRLKDEFLATMSHELRTPMTAILGWTQLLRAGGFDAPTTESALATIERNAQAQVRLISDLLDVSRIITGKLRLDLRPVSLASIVEAAVGSVQPAAQAKEIRLQILFDSQVSPVSGDPDRLQQVVWNLLSNAIKFTPKKGRVRVSLEQVDSHLEISVSDNGQGIAPEFLPHVFDRFRQADASHTRMQGGLGLGLAIVRQIVELHGGTTSVASPGEGRGATFTVSLPILAVHQRGRDLEEATAGAHLSSKLERRLETRAPAPREGLPELAGVRVLVVEDEADARALISAVLERCGAAVSSAASVDEALRELERALPDLLVSDIGMPGEDGYSLIKKVRALPPERGGRVPAIALTAYARAEDRIKVLACGFQMHVTKPVEPAELVAVVASLAGRRGV